MTGNLTLGTDKITLDATDGSAQFAGPQTLASVTSPATDGYTSYIDAGWLFRSLFYCI